MLLMTLGSAMADIYWEENFGENGIDPFWSLQISDCSSGASEVELLGGNNVTLNNTWYCGYLSSPTDVDMVATSLYTKTPYGNSFSMNSGGSSNTESRMVTFLDTPLNLTNQDILRFTCTDLTESRGFYFLGFLQKDTPTKGLVLSLKSGGCSNTPSFMDSNDCYELSSLATYDCSITQRDFYLPLSLIDYFYPSFNWNDVNDQDYVFLASTLADTYESSIFFIDDISLDNVEYEQPVGESVTNITWYEDFELLNFTSEYIDNTYDCFGYPPYFEYDGQFGTPEACKYGIDATLSRSNNTKDGSSYSLKTNSTSNGRIISYYGANFPTPINIDNDFLFSFDCLDTSSGDTNTKMFFSVEGTDPTLYLSNSGQTYSLDNIAGFPCNGTWTTFNITASDLPSSFIGKNLSSLDIEYYQDEELYIDNLFFTNGKSNVTGSGNNSYPYANYYGVNPLTGDTDVDYEFYISISDSESDTMYTGFDCDNDGSLEYNLSVTTGISGFNCTYSSTGIKTGVFYVTDSNHTPTTINFTQDVNVTNLFIRQDKIYFFNETFGTDAFSFDEAECTMEGSNWTSMQGFGDPMDLGNYKWWCYMDYKSFNYISFDNTSNLEKINTPQGLNLYSSSTSLIGQRHRKLATWQTDNSSFFDIDLTADDYISFSCQINDQATQIDTYLTFSYTQGDEVLLLSLGADSEDGDRCGLSGLPDAYCCQLADIVGEDYDCKNSVKTNVKFTVEQLVDACNGTGLGYSDLNDIKEVGLWLVEYNFAGYSNVYLDDIQIYETYTYVNGTNITEETNTVPTLVYIDADQNPANLSDTVTWTFQSTDLEDTSEDIWTAFDCDVDRGTIDYPYTLNRTTIASQKWEVECNYSSIGTYTAKAYVSDVEHYPYLEDTLTSTVDVEILSPEENETETFCVGFTAPSCPSGTGTCWFYDDFNYNYKIGCNGWDGGGDIETFFPEYSHIFKIEDFDINEFSMYNKGDRVTIYDTVGYKLDFYLNTTLSLYSYLLDSNADISAYFQVTNYNAYAYDDEGLTLLLANLNSSTWYNIYAILDFSQQTVAWYIDDEFITTKNFYDQEVEGFSEIAIGWNDVDGIYQIDNVLVEYGDLNPNATEEEPDIEYTYNPSRFCAINWTAEAGDRFKEEFCEERGFSTDYPAIGLCVPRACIQDMGLAIVDWATSNIFTTIIIVVAFILIAPLLIRRR